jgi:3-oxoacyl-[acyl-carrier protein] reductase
MGVEWSNVEQHPGGRICTGLSRPRRRSRQAGKETRTPHDPVLLRVVSANGSRKQIPVEEWDRLMAVNLRGIFLCCRAVVPYMKQQQRGKIINISSGTVFYGAPLVAHYVTSKAGVIGLTRSLARELGEYNINVNAVAPGLTLSLDEVSEARMARNQQRLQARPFKRTEVPQDLVGTIVFLCSSESDFMTGQTLVVDGGAQMH